MDADSRFFMRRGAEPDMDICPGNGRVQQVANLLYVSMRRGAARGMGNCRWAGAGRSRAHAALRCAASWRARLRGGPGDPPHERHCAQEA